MSSLEGTAEFMECLQHIITTVNLAGSNTYNYVLQHNTVGFSFIYFLMLWEKNSFSVAKSAKNAVEIVSEL